MYRTCLCGVATRQRFSRTRHEENVRRDPHIEGSDRLASLIKRRSLDPDSPFTV